MIHFRTLLLLITFTTYAPGAALFGTLKGPGGSPYIGAEVYIESKELEKPATIKTGEDGGYRLNNLKNGSYTLGVRVEGDNLALIGDRGWNTKKITIQNDKDLKADLVLEALTTLEIKFFPPAGASRLEGTVIASNPFKRVSINNNIVTLKGMKPGKQTINYTTSLFGSGRFEINLQEGKITDTLITLEEGEYIEGIVMSPDNAPLFGVNIRARNIGMRIQTDKDGVFKISRPDNGDTPLFLSHPEYPDTSVLLTPQMQAAGIEILMPRPADPVKGIISGYVDEEIKNCRVTASPTIPPDNASSPRRGRLRSKTGVIGKGGEFILDGLGESAQMVTIQCRDRHEWSKEARPGDDLGYIQLSPVVLLNGLVIDAQSSEPVSNFSTAIYQGTPPEEGQDRRPGRGRNRPTPHNDGTFSMKSRYDGDNFICIEARDYLPLCQEYNTAKYNGSPKTFALDGGLKLTFFVKSQSGPVEGARIFMHPGKGTALNINFSGGRGGRRPGRNTTDKNGKLEIGAIKAGPFSINVSHPDYAPFQDDLEVTSSKTFYIQLEPASYISGTVYYANGAAADNLNLVCIHDSRSGLLGERTLRRPQLMDKGRFKISGLSENYYTLVLGRQQGRRNMLPLFRLDNIPSGISNLNIKLLPERSWMVEIISDNGSAVKNASVLFCLADSVGRFQEYDVMGLSYAMDAKKTLKIETFIGSKYLLKIKAPGFLPCLRQVAIPAGKGTFITSIKLTPSPVIKGKIIHYNPKMSFNGYSIETPANTGGPKAILKDSGSFTFTDIAPGPLPILVKDKKGVPVYFGIAVYNYQNPEDLNIQLEISGKIAGTVKDYNFTAKKNVTIYLNSRHHTHNSSQKPVPIHIHNTISDKQGNFSFKSVPPGIYEVCPEQPFGQCARVQVVSSKTVITSVIAPSTIKSVRIAMDLPSQTPEVGGAYLHRYMAAITAKETNPRQYLPDMATFNNIPAGSYLFTSWSRSGIPGTYHSTMDIIEVSDNKKHFDIYVSERGFNLLFESPSGAVIPGVDISIIKTGAYWDDHSRRGANAWELTAQSDAQGKAEIFGLDSGVYVLRFSHSKLAAAPIMHTLKSKEKLEDVQIKMAFAGHVQAALTCGTMPYDHAQLAVYDSSGSLLRVITPDAIEFSGTYNLGAFLPGSYYISVFGDFLSREYQVFQVKEYQDQKISIELPPSGFAEIVGEKIRDENLYLVDSQGSIISLSEKRHLYAAGQYNYRPSSILFEGLQAGQYQVFIEGNQEPLANITVKEGKITVVEVD